MSRAVVRLCTLLLLLAAGSAVAADLPESWPDQAGASPGLAVAFPSRSPFTPAQMAEAAAATVPGTLFLPDSTSAAAPVPAVVLLHGSGGILPDREPAYASQLAALGLAALVVDTYAARRAQAGSYLERVLNIPEPVAAADAYAALAYLATRSEIDAQRVVLMGFSYGGLATLFAANKGVADRLALGPQRFLAHVAYYAPCVGEFADPRTTRAPILMLEGALDTTNDLARCRETALAFRGGGSDTRLVVYDDAYHQWDGAPGTDWQAPRGVRNCRFRVEADGTVRDLRTRLAMTGPTRRMLILSLCADRTGYRVKADPAVRARSTAELARFLNSVLATTTG